MTVGFLPLLGDEGLPALRGHQFFSTQFDVVPVVLVLGALALYLWAVARVNRFQPRHQWPVGRTAALIGALATTSVAIFSFVGVYDGELFYDHMIQHLLLIMVAAPLFAIASPIDLAWRATRGDLHVVLTKALRSRVARYIGHPATGFVLYAVTIPLTHLTSWYNYTLLHESVHNAEHLVYLVIGYLFWRQIFGSDPNRYRLHPGLKFAYLFMAIPVDTFTGLSLAGATHSSFPAYLSLHRNWGPSLVLDLHYGGVIMWVAGDTLMLWPMIPVALSWMHLEERRGVRADRAGDLRDAREGSVEMAAGGTAFPVGRDGPRQVP